MRLKLKDENTGGELLLFKEEPAFDRLFFTRDRFNKYFTIAWNPGESQTVTIDGAEYEFPKNSLLTLLFNQSFSFKNSATIIAWKFNREFYCIIGHDSEVSCVGFLFSTNERLKAMPSPFYQIHLLRRWLFNFRQNGYDISADPIGNPESYYTPPTEAISRIEIVRGAASLQYGTQFGGFTRRALGFPGPGIIPSDGRTAFLTVGLKI